MQAALYDDKECEVEPTIKMQASPQALQVTGNAHLLRMPAAFLPQCAALQVNGQETDYQIRLEKNKRVEQSDVPYLQLSAYLQEECSVEPDFQISLIADGSVHPIGSFTSEQIARLNQYFNPGVMQTQVVHDDPTPFAVFYKASCAGTISFYSSLSAPEGSELMTVPLEQFMNTCYTPASPFPGFQSSEIGARTQSESLDQVIAGMLTSVATSEVGHIEDRAVKPQGYGRRWAKDATSEVGHIEDRAVKPQGYGRRWAKDAEVDESSVSDGDNRIRAIKPQGYGRRMAKGVQPQTQSRRRDAEDETVEDALAEGEDRTRAVKPQGYGRRMAKGVQPQTQSRRRDAEDETVEDALAEGEDRTRAVKPQGYGRRWAKGELLGSSADHVADLFKGMSEHLRTRSEQGMPISFQLTCSTKDAALLPPLADEVFGPGAGHPEPLPHPHVRPHPHPHGFDQYMAPHNQSVALVILGLLATMIVVRTFIYGKKEQSATPIMQQRTTEKNKDYVAVPSTAC